MKIEGALRFDPYYKLLAVLLCLLAIGLFAVRDYGISPDEQNHIFQPLWLREFIANGQPIPSDNRYYGAAFDWFFEGIFQAQRFLQAVFFSKTEILDGENVDLWKYYGDRILLKHYVTFLFSSIAYISVAGLSSLLVGIEYAWFSPLILALFPRFWGHSFFNPKDIPFAALFALSIWMGCYLVDRYVKHTSGEVLDPKKTALFSIACGLVFGALTGIRAGGVAILAFVAIAYLALLLSQNVKTLRSWRQVAVFYLLLLGTWLLTTIVFYPQSWFYPLSPVLWFFEAVRYHAAHPWGGTVLFNGDLIKATNLPRTYLPMWFFISTPLILQVLFWTGLAFAIAQYERLSQRQKIAVVLVALQVFALPLFAILRGSTLFDGIRHFLFILPGVAVFAVFGGVCLYRLTKNRLLKRVELVAIAVILGAIAVQMVQLHPYQYTYFNSFSRQVLAAGDRYETDYWGLSLREGIEWIDRQTDSPTPVVVSVPWLVPQVRFFAPSHLPVVSKGNLGKFPVSSFFPFYYYLARPRGTEREDFSHCPVVYTVNRNPPLAAVKKCETL